MMSFLIEQIRVFGNEYPGLVVLAEFVLIGLLVFGLPVWLIPSNDVTNTYKDGQ